MFEVHRNGLFYKRLFLYNFHFPINPLRDCEFEPRSGPLAFKVVILHTCMKHQSHIYGTRYRLVFFIFFDSISSSTSSLQMLNLWHYGRGIY